MTTWPGLLRLVSSTALEYKPKWYHIGDPDQPLIAVIYGLIALATVMRVEDLAEQCLFPAREKVSLSDLGALVTFRSATWVEIVKWLCLRKKGSRLSKKALFGIFFRIIVTVAEVLILVASIPRAIPVFENDVGGASEITFREGGYFVTDTMPSTEGAGRSCNIDKVPMVGFQESISRLVCFRATSLYVTPKITNLSRDLFSTAAFYSRRPVLRNTSEVYFMKYNPDLYQLEITSARSMHFYSIAHSLLYRNYTTDLPGRVVLYPLPDDIVLQASEMILRTPQLKEICTIAAPLNVLNDTVLLICNEISKHELDSPDTFPSMLFNVIMTRKVNTSGKKYLGRDNFQRTNIEIGSVNRPRLCIYPALILLAVLVLLSIFSRILCSSGNLTLQLWQSRSNDPHIIDSNNPVFPYASDPISATSAAF